MRKLIERFLQLESASGIILFAMAVLAMVLANSPLAYLHQQFIDASLFWINEVLMALFFLVVGLELKRGFIEGQLSDFSQIILPLAAAIGGMLMPILVYVMINYGHSDTLRGWATPDATDIAFALTVLSLFGRRIPPPLKLFLLALAIFDDIGAILIIAIFYSHDLSYFALFLSALLTALLYLFNRFNVRSFAWYGIIGAGIWLCFFHAGIHPTIAGILLALAIPADTNPSLSLLDQVEDALHPWVAYLIMPLFALANAGISFKGLSWEIFSHVVVAGIALGLFVGKQAGVMAFSWLVIQSGLTKLPEKSTWLMLYGVSLLCGIGFTMSLFLGTLSFQNESSLYFTEVRLGVIAGSLLSGLAGAAMLLIALE